MHVSIHVYFHACRYIYQSIHDGLMAVGRHICMAGWI